MASIHAPSADLAAAESSSSVAKAGRSLRKTLLWVLVTALAVLASCSGLVSYLDALTEANELFDAKLAHSARVLEAVTNRADGESGQPLVVEVWRSNLSGSGDDLVTADGHVYETKLSFQAWSKDGQLLLRSSNAHDEPLAPLQVGFADVVIDGQPWRTFTLRNQHGEWFQTGEDRAIRGELAEGIAQSALLPWLFAVPTMGLVVWFVVGAGSRSLERVTEQVAHRDPQRLTPIRADQAPIEILGLVQAINGLLARLDDTLERERRFTEDAAHELRTPLAALKVHAQNLSASRTNDERESSLNGLLSGVDRSQRLIDQLLQLARLDPAAVDPDLEINKRFDLNECLAQQMADLATFAEQRAVTMRLYRCDDAKPVSGDDAIASVLFRNLIDNAIRYGPQGANVEVRIRANQSAQIVEVCDQGPGIDDASRDAVFRRFHRGLGSGQSGSGLGLSIAEKAAERLHAKILLSPVAEPGLRVCVSFASPEQLDG